MDLLPLIPDNVGEMLVKIVRFTELRRALLERNVQNAQVPDFTPTDMPVDEFSTALEEALAEHLLNSRLVFRDTENIKFGANGTMQVKAVVDEHADALLRQDHSEYIELQTSKLLENTVNRRVAEELLKLNCGGVSVASSSWLAGAGLHDTASEDIPK